MKDNDYYEMELSVTEALEIEKGRIDEKVNTSRYRWLFKASIASFILFLLMYIIFGQTKYEPAGLASVWFLLMFPILYIAWSLTSYFIKRRLNKKLVVFSGKYRLNKTEIMMILRSRVPLQTTKKRKTIAISSALIASIISLIAAITETMWLFGGALAAISPFIVVTNRMFKEHTTAAMDMADDLFPNADIFRNKR